MPSPRDTLKSRKEQKKASALKNLKAAESKVTITADVFEDAEALITVQVGAGHCDITTDQLIMVFIQENGRFVRHGRREHIEALVEAYAAYVLLKSAPDFDELISELAAKNDIKVSPTTDCLKIILQTKIFYSDAVESGAASKLYSRDVRAIRHLLERKVKPSKVLDLHGKDGEGLDYWARNAPRKNRSPSSKFQRMRPVFFNLDSHPIGHSFHFVLNGKDIKFDIPSSSKDDFLIFLDPIAKVFKSSES